MVAGALFLALPAALVFDGEPHISQAAWLGMALAGGMFALVVGNAGAALLLAWSALWLLGLRALAAQGKVPAGMYGVAGGAHAHLVGGVALLALTPVIFAGRGELLANLLRMMILLCAAWWLLELLGLDPLLRVHPTRGYGADGMRGACLGSSVIMGGLLGAAWPLFVSRRWWPGLVLLVPALAWQQSATGWLAAGAAGAGWLFAWLLANGREALAKELVAYAAVILGFGLLAAIMLHPGPGADQRLMIWSAAAEGASWLGFGPGSWPHTLGRRLGHASPYSGYVLALWEYGWIGLGVVLAGLGQLLWQARRRPMMLGAVLGAAAASAGTLIWEQPVSAAWCLLLFGLVEVKPPSLRVSSEKFVQNQKARKPESQKGIKVQHVG